jgi:hypothetical protein
MGVSTGLGFKGTKGRVAGWDVTHLRTTHRQHGSTHGQRAATAVESREHC